MALLQLHDVKKIYDQGKIEVPALRGIDLEVDEGEFTTVFGPSGSGKTTLLNIIGCLDKPTAGTVTFAGSDLGGLDKKALARIRRHNIGFIFQSYNLIPVLTAYENVEFAARLVGKLQQQGDPGPGVVDSCRCRPGGTGRPQAKRAVRRTETASRYCEGACQGAEAGAG